MMTATDNSKKSKAEIVASLSHEERRKLFAGYTSKELELLESDWDFWARPNQKLPPGDWLTWLLLAGRGFGKALPLDTPIPTPQGWKTMEELQVGDQVFDENGNPCNVTFVTPIQYDRDCYEITFDDKKTVVADADHQWAVASKDADIQARIMTTSQILRKMSEGLYIGRFDIDCGCGSKHLITSVVKVESVPVKCIQVDSPNSLYLCTDYFLVTHNTRVSSETAIYWQNPEKVTNSSTTIKGYSRFALIGQTTADIRDVMLFGESGIITCAPKHNKPEYIASRRVLEWPNGAKAHLYSGDEPEQLRGPQHEKALVDELVKFKYPEETWDMMELGLRLGDKPQVVCTTTPKPKKIIKKLVADADTYITTGSSYENVANLSPSFIKRVIKKYEGTRLGRQELYAEILGDAEGALWNRDNLEKNRVDVYPTLKNIIIAIDPSVTNKDTSDECGIIVAGIDRFERAFVLEDASDRMESKDWARKAVNLYHKYRADLIVAEVNNGGDLVKTVINFTDPRVPVETVWASRDKYTRATPVASVYEQDRVCHVGLFPKLEDELVEWEPGELSPNRLDALVWAITWLLLQENEYGLITACRRPF